MVWSPHIKADINKSKLEKSHAPILFLMNLLCVTKMLYILNGHTTLENQQDIAKITVLQDIK